MLACLIVVPTFNEIGNIENLVKAVLEKGSIFNVLIVDDNSPDGTGELADRLALEYPDRVSVMHRTGKQGLGSAYLAGFKYGLERDYDYIFEMDADFSHDPKYLPALLKGAQETGVAVGSRIVKGGGVRNWAWYRRFISRGGSLYSKTILGLKVKDCTSGFKCFSRETLKLLDLEKNISSKGFGFQIEVNCLCEWNDLEVREVPIIFPDRVKGQSKMSKKIFMEAMLMVWKLRANKKVVLSAMNPAFPSIPASEPKFREIA